MIKTILIDDEENSRRAAETALTDYDDVEITGSYGSVESFKEDLSKMKQKPDLLMLDIEMKGQSGFDLARFLHEKEQEMLFIFLTGHASYAIDGYGFHPVDFLTKPIRKEKLDAAMQEVRRILGKEKRYQNTELLFRLNQGYRLIRVGEICYIERRDRKNILVLPDEEVTIGRYSMKELEDMLVDHGFVLCHQSFLVNETRIVFVGDEGRQQYYLKVEGSSVKIPVSRNHYEKLLEVLKQQGNLRL